ncbi:MAG: tripartite tricarboxylate transporter permease [Candidatus Woesearchaeota archaeon]|nr:MAG: tripartite tricarboxylate transporter permease [Candidatus Woesearchaeota archaeon]
MFELFIAVLVGILFGVFTGLTPGVHVNLVTTILVGISAILLDLFSPLTIACFIVAMALTHTFLDSLPAVYLGAPDEDQVLSVLPGHRMLLEGRGYEAVKLSLIGSLGALILTVILIYPFVILIEKIFPFLEKYIVYLLIFIVVLLILRENKKSWAFVLFLLSGLLGLGVFGLHMRNPLLPMLSGLFGVSSLLLSIFDKVIIPEQRITKPKVGKGIIARAIGVSTLSGSLVGLLPGVGGAQASIIASQVAGNIGDKGFLVLVGGTNTANFVVSFVSLYVLNKARNGAIVAVSKILEILSLQNLIIFIGVSLFAGGVATILALIISRFYSRYITRINYAALCIGIIVFVAVLVFIFSSWLGLFILFISTMVGLIPPLVNCGRNHLMGCLIFPVILFFLL